MGASIAAAASILRVPVYLIDTNSDTLANGLVRIDKIFAHLEKRFGQDLKTRRMLIKADRKI